MSKRLWSIIFSCSVVLSFAVQAQQDAGPLPVGETVEVTLINVDVYVTDKNGNRVRGLRSDDFTLTENDVPQQISNFSEVNESSAADSPGSVIRGRATRRVPRTLVVFMDDVHVHPTNAKLVFASVKDAVRTAIRKGDGISIVRWRSGLETALEFTDDVAAAERALDELQRHASRPYDLRTDVFESPMLIVDDSGAPHNARPVVSRDRVSRTVHQSALEAKAQLSRKIAAINATIVTLASGEGKKALLLVSDRLSAVAGADRFYAAGLNDVPGELARDLDMRPAIRTIINTANANGVTVYAIHPEGLRHTQTDVSSSARFNTGYATAALANETPMLREVASGTGGLAAWGANDVPKMLPSLAEDFNAYYSLAYPIRSRREDRTRLVTVKTKNPDYVVRAQRSYVERSEETKMRDRVTASLFRKDSGASFPIAAQAGEPRRSGRKDLIPVAVRIPIGALTALPQSDGSYIAWISVWATHGSKADAVATPTSERHTFKIAAGELEKAAQTYVTYTVDVAVPRGADRVAIGVLDEVSRSYGVTRLDVGPVQKSGL